MDEGGFEASIRSHRDLRVWQRAMEVAEMCYRHTAGFPREEIYSSAQQVRRSAASVAANIAEGYGRDSKGAYVQFLKMAQGSLKELETHLVLAARVGTAPSREVERILGGCSDIGKMLRALIRSLE
jgi:four helix bundle protein